MAYTPLNKNPGDTILASDINAMSAQVADNEAAIGGKGTYSKPDGGIPTEDIASRAITNAKIAFGAVTEGLLASNAVSEGKLGAELAGKINGKADAAALAETDARLDALYKLTKGQAWDTREDTAAAYAKTVPDGGHAVNVDKIGGKSLAVNQLNDNLHANTTVEGVTFANNGDGSWTVTAPATHANAVGNVNAGLSTDPTVGNISIAKGHKYLIRGAANGVRVGVTNAALWDGSAPIDAGGGVIKAASASGSVFLYCNAYTDVEVGGETVYPQIVDLSLMFGPGNEPTAQQFGAMYPGYIPHSTGALTDYSADSVVSKDTDSETLGTMDVSELAAKYFPLGMRSAGNVYDELDFDRMVAVQRIGAVDLGTLGWLLSNTAGYEYYRAGEGVENIKQPSAGTIAANIACTAYTSDNVDNIYRHRSDRIIGIRQTGGSVDTPQNRIWIWDSRYPVSASSGALLKADLNGVMLYYELATPVETPITEDVDGLLAAAPGGTLSFVNGHAAAVPVTNKTTWFVNLAEAVEG